MQCKEPWPEATLPRHAGVVTFRLRGGLPRGVAVLCDRRPTLALHTCVKGSAQAVKPDVCRCAALKRKHLLQHISSSTISTIKNFSPKVLQKQYKQTHTQTKKRVLFFCMCVCLWSLCFLVEGFVLLLVVVGCCWLLLVVVVLLLCCCCCCCLLLVCCVVGCVLSVVECC